MPFSRLTDPELLRALTLAERAADHDAADHETLRATAERVPDGDADAWVLEWIATAGAAWADAHLATQRSATRRLYRCAATYYAVALAAIDRSSDADRRIDVWRRQRLCWDRAAALVDPPAVRLAVPYGDTTLPGYFFRAPCARPGERRATVIVNDGDGPTSQAWGSGGAAAAARGYHWATFDGPGQQAALIDQGLTLRPDWEAVLTPVLDTVLARDDVDPERVALIGTGPAGGWIPRALGSEHRLAAAVVDPGVVDPAAPWLATLPATVTDQLRCGDRAAFDREFRLAVLSTPALEDGRRRTGEPYGMGDDASPAALAEALAAFRLADDLRPVTTPLLITDPDDERSWPGQSGELGRRLPGPTTVAACSAATREGRIFGWLEARLG